MLWGMMMLVLLTKPITEDSSSRHLVGANLQYEFLLQRRLRWIFSNKKENPNCPISDPDEAFSQAMTIVKNISKVGNILKFVMDMVSK